MKIKLISFGALDGRQLQNKIMKGDEKMDNKLETISNLFEDKEIRSIWVSEKEDYLFSVIDVINALTDSDYEKSRNYWKWLKNKLDEEGSQLVSNTNQLKMRSPKDCKSYLTDVLDTEGIFRLIESIPSPKAEPFKLWLAKLGREKVDEVFDPSKGIDQMIDFYTKKGYSIEWIEARIKAIISRKKLTNTWKENGINDNIEYAILTNDIYKEWSGMTASEYKAYKGIRKESLRDNMTDIEVALTDLGEIATRNIAKNERPIGLKENRKAAKRGGNIAKKAKEFYESETGLNAITKDNYLIYQYPNELELLDFKNILISNIDKIHTTALGEDRIKKNLKLNDDAVNYLKGKLLDDKSIVYKEGKNYYCEIDNIRITINSYNYCIITAHRIKTK